MESAFALRNKANAAAAAGDHAQAARLYAEAVRQHPGNADLLNSAGNYHARRHADVDALWHFDRALAADPGHVEAALNRAILLARLGRRTEALADLRRGADRLGGNPRYWTTRAAIERELGEVDAAVTSYDTQLSRDGRNQKALAGRARLALERGEPGMCQHFERALSVDQSDADAWLGYAQALDYQGRSADARRLLEQLLQQAPGWAEALELLASLRWADGDTSGFCDPFAAASAAQPGNPALYLSWCRTLATVDQTAEAAIVASRAAALLPNDPLLALADATYSSEAGATERAERLFSQPRSPDPAWLLQEAKHRLRTQEPARAARLLEQVTTMAPDTIAAWSLLDFAWRLLEDPRADWLHGQPGLVTKMALDLDAAALRDLVSLLDDLHDHSGLPVGHGQSVRGGSQTRGGLFQRMEPEIRAFRAAIERMIERYRAQLPPKDVNHPLLRHRDQPWTIRGSWSIRMTGQGRHVAHIHPQGLLSSAAYLVLPADIGGPAMAGCLELGRPPADLPISLPPVQTLTPEEGHCALFPSTLFHGTRPFEAGRRMTIAFDVSLIG